MSMPDQDQEPESLYKIMKELAEKAPVPYAYDGATDCLYCTSWSYTAATLDVPDNHQPSCPWRRLNEELARMEKTWAEREQVPTIQLTARIGEY